MDRVRDDLVTLGADVPPGDRVFGVNPLAPVGTRERDGGYDLAPKHAAFPLGARGRRAARIPRVQQHAFPMPRRPGPIDTLRGPGRRRGGVASRGRVGVPLRVYTSAG